MFDALRSVIEYLWGPTPIIAVQAFFGPDVLRLFEGLTLLGEAEAVLVVAALTLWFRGRSLASGLLAIVLMVASINLLPKRSSTCRVHTIPESLSGSCS